jgi:hypothetical protein
MSHLAQAAAAQSEIAVIPARSAADAAAVVQAHSRIFAASNKLLTLVLFVF